MSKQYVMNAPRIIHKTSGGEVVAIDLGSGAYYSMRGAATTVWAALEAGLTVDDIAEHVRAGHEAGDADVFADVTRFVDELLAFELIVAGDSERTEPPAVGERQPYEPPVVEAFTDMADVILLDPVHDVDATAGWPHQAQADGAPEGG